MIYLLLILPALPLMLFAAVCICARLPRKMQKSDCIIVLGAKVRADGTLSYSLEQRCIVALDLYRRGMAERVIVCGGQAAYEPIPEAQAMRGYLAARGVPEEAVLTEDQSRFTYENLAHAREIMRQHGLENALIVTSDYHIQRASWLAREAGVTACFAAAPSPTTPKHRIRARLQESVSWAMYLVRKIRKTSRNGSR